MKIIPKLKPSQFDDYMFDSWKPNVSNAYYEYFHIERIEKYKSFLKLPVLPHRRSVYFFVCITKGYAIRSKGLSQYEVRPGSIFCLTADQITSLEVISEDVEGYYCHFHSEIFNHGILNINIEQAFPFFQITAEPLLYLKQTDRIHLLFEILINEYSLNDINRSEIIALYLITLLKEVDFMQTLNSKSQTNAALRLTQKYKNLLSAFIYDKRTVTEFAEALNVTPNHLHKSVKVSTGKSAHELLEEMRILEAKVLLKQTDLNIADIAYKLGGFDPSDFSRFFKSITNLTPKQYRNLQK